MKRTQVIVCAGLVLLAGCRDLGLPGNVPAEQSRTAAPPELVAEVTASAPDADVRLVMDGRLWVPTGRPVEVTEGALRPVGSTAGRTLYARWWDERPYRAIFTRLDPDPAGARSAREAMVEARREWQEYAPVIGVRGQAPPAPTAPAPTAPDPEVPDPEVPDPEVPDPAAPDPAAPAPDPEDPQPAPSP